jgi:lysophospholipase L1-like esterase
VKIQVTGENAPNVVVDGRQGVVIEAAVGPVSSVNGRGGAVTGLAEAADVPGVAEAAVEEHAEASDPHGDRAYASATFATQTLTARTDRGIYIPPGWGTGWRTKLAAAQAGSGKAVLATVGGSSTQGYYASNVRTKGWVDLLRTSLQATYGDGGSGFRGSSLTSLFQTANSVPAEATAAYNAAGNLATLSGTWSAGGNDFGPGAYYVFTQQAGATWTLSVRGSTIRIYTVGGGGNHANFTYSVDGSAAVPVTDIGGAQQIQVTTITGLSAASHQVVLTYAGTGSNFLSVCGIAGENTSGVIVNNFARYGSRAANYSGVTVSGDQTMSTGYNGGPQYPADLVILTHGPNDANNNDSGDTWAKNTRKMISYIRDGAGATGTTDLAIMMPHVGAYDTTNYLYQDYCERALGLAHTFGAAVVNMWTLGNNSWNYWHSFGYWANASSPGTAGTDQVHPSDAGHQAIADVLAPILTA